MTMPVLDLSFITDVMETVGVDQRTIDLITDMLKTNADDIYNNRPEPTGSAAFGDCEAGLDLDVQTAKAQQHVAEAMAQMQAGLLGYRDSLISFRANTEELDGSVGADLSKRQAQVDLVVSQSVACTTGEDFTDASNNVCTLPTEDGDA